MNWLLLKESLVIEFLKFVVVKEVLVFIKDVYWVFCGSENIENILSGLKRIKLLFLKGFLFEKVFFYLLSNFLVIKVILIGCF